MIDRWTMFFVILGVSVPSFVFAALIQWQLTELNLKTGTSILPIAGWWPAPQEGVTIGIWGRLQYLILPGIVLGIATMAFLTRLMRSSLLEVVNLDYIRTAKAKGVPPVRVFFSHQLRNAVLPVITYLGPAIAGITTGGFVVETVFAVPGLGRYFVQAFQQLDYTVIMGVTVFYGSFLVFMVVLVDIIYGFVDPRISLSKSGK
jgi:ABC-type dipeptide/oligopeptide/nickel transport system permease component